MSIELAVKLRLGLADLETVREQFATLLSLPAGERAGVIERSAWHKDLLVQMSVATARRPAVLSVALVAVFSEYLAFRHLFRGASIVLMRWDKLLPLLSRIGETHESVDAEVRAFICFIETA